VPLPRLFKDKHQAVGQGNISSKLKAPSSKEKTPSAQLSASRCEHLQKPYNAGSRREALFSNSLAKVRSSKHRDSCRKNQRRCQKQSRRVQDSALHEHGLGVLVDVLADAIALELLPIGCYT
jgi:hypothetical protein